MDNNYKYFNGKLSSLEEIILKTVNQQYEEGLLNQIETALNKKGFVFASRNELITFLINRSKIRCMVHNNYKTLIIDDVHPICQWRDDAPINIKGSTIAFKNEFIS